MIKIEDLLPLLKKGYVAMDKSGVWFWYSRKPLIARDAEEWRFVDGCARTLGMFDLAPYAGDWKDSLMECGR